MLPAVPLLLVGAAAGAAAATTACVALFKRVEAYERRKRKENGYYYVRVEEPEDTTYKDTFVYALIRDEEAVYFGITRDPSRREKEHRYDFKEFDYMKILRGPVSEDEARRIEKKILSVYRSRCGANPLYNATDHG